MVPEVALLADGELVLVCVGPVLVLFPVVDEDAGATLASEATMDHDAAALTVVLFCWYGRKETTPVLSS